MGFNYIDIMELTTYSGDQKTYGYHKHDGSEREGGHIDPSDRAMVGGG